MLIFSHQCVETISAEGWIIAASHGGHRIVGSRGANIPGLQHGERSKETIFNFQSSPAIGSDKNSLFPDTVIVLMLMI